MDMRMRERVPEDQLGPHHPFGKDFVESGPRPNVVKRGPANLRIRAAMRDSAADDDTRTSSSGLCDQIVMLRGQARVRDLKGVEDAQFDQSRKMRQGT